jgi:beta-galactosidase
MTPVCKTSISFIIALLSWTLFSCERDTVHGHFRNADFNSDWQFHLGDIPDISGPEVEGLEWTPVHLPHDWGILDYADQDSLHSGPFFKKLPGGRDVGYLRDGTAWYRKDFVTPENSVGKQLIMSFDGVQTQMELWVNGHLMGEHVYGYTPFQVEITPALRGPGQHNWIAVKTVNPGENSRWYAGDGIYRPVTLSMLEPVSIGPWGVYLTTPEVSFEKATVQLEINVNNHSESFAEVSAEVLISSPDQDQITLFTDKANIGSNSGATLTASGTIDEPAFWDVDQPRLYRATVILREGRKEVDRYVTSFGIRSIEYSADYGFLLNGKEILLKGACMHHDNGLLGAAAFRDAEYRRVRRMKENGYNAIRTSHNPPSESFLNACDELGMVVIDEAFDQWMKPKRPNDYSNYFEQWHRKDVQSMVYRDRNHPSVVMWSIGNEVPERADPEGIEIGKMLIEAIREVDETRPVTQAVCAFWDQPGKDWDYSAGAFSILDIGGYNYQFQNYEPDHQKYPERIMYGSESVPQHAWENWEMVRRHSYVIGDFVWTGMDYIGESGIGHNDVVSRQAPQTGSFLMPWPWYISWCGDLDILGNKKPQSYYRDVVWGESNLEILAVTPVGEGKECRLSYWGWYDELKTWNWEGHEGDPILVKVYSTYPEVRLEVNGEEVGRVRIDSTDKYTALLEVPFYPGELKATGIRDGKDQESQTLETTGPSGKLQLLEEQARIPAGKNSLAYINIVASDSEGRVVPNDDSEVTIHVSGPAQLLAAGNGGPILQGSLTDHIIRLYRGRGMIILRSTGQAGTIRVEVRSPGLDSGATSLEAI